MTANSRVNEQWAMNAGLTFKSLEYPTRTDDFTEVKVGVAYTYSTYVNFDASFTIRENATDNRDLRDSTDFTQNVFSITANVRYW